MSPIQELLSQAHAAWDLFELERAAELFETAAEAESVAAGNRSAFALPDQSFLYRVRAAICRWDAGEFERARGVLLEALSFDWKAARLWGDRRDTEWAFTRLLLERAATGDRDSFVALWKVATARGDELSVPFPTVIPHQKRLLRACACIAYQEGIQQIIARIDPKRLPADHELQMLVADARRR
jgi:hypothetical protein